MSVLPRRRPAALTAVLAVACVCTAVTAVTVLPVVPLAGHRAPAAVADATPPSYSGPGFCPPSGLALHYSDALDKVTVGGATVGGLSSLAYDRSTHTWASAVDNHNADPSRIWFFDNLVNPHIVGSPLVLRQPDGVPYTGQTADNEGLAVLPDGRFVVSSETEPSIRIFDRRGVQQSSLPVPSRFAVTPRGEATANATLEGLTLTPSGRRLIAAMEGTLSGDTGGGVFRRFLVYDQDRAGNWSLTKQIGYRVEPGNRVSEIAAYSDDAVLVMEAAFGPAGNTVSLFAARGVGRATDVSAQRDLAATGDVLAKSLVADVTRCPTLGAPAKETQINPLLDNFEGMALTTPAPLAGLGVAGVSLISDDNFSAGQTTRIVDLGVRLPR